MRVSFNYSLEGPFFSITSVVALSTYSRILMTYRVLSSVHICPIEVVGSDGLKRYYFNNDLVAYKAAMRSRRYPVGRTFLKPAPKGSDF